MADFQDPQSDKEGFESDGSLDDNIIGPTGEEKARATQVKTMPVRALLAAMADIGDIVEEAGCKSAKCTTKKTTFEASLRCRRKRKGDPYHVILEDFA